MLSFETDLEEFLLKTPIVKFLFFDEAFFDLKLRKLWAFL